MNCESPGKNPKKMPTNQIPGSAVTPPKRGRAEIWQNLDMGMGRGRRPRAREMAAGRGRQDFCERENSGFPEIEMADRTQFRDRRMWGGRGERVIYVNT